MDITTEEGASKVRELTCCMGKVNALQQPVEEGDRKTDTMDTAANAVRCKGDFVMYALGLLMISRLLCYGSTTNCKLVSKRQE